MPYQHIKAPAGEKITIENGKLSVPNNPVLPYIEGDGTGPDIWRASQRVFDAAVQKAYGSKRKISWFEVYAGEKAFNSFKEWLPLDTLTAFREYLVGIKGPLTTPVGGGIRSLNVALRQELDLYVCLRPVRYFNGIETPVKRPQDVDMTIFRENTEDTYAGIEFAAGTPELEKVKNFFKTEFPKSFAKIRFPDSVAIGLKPVSREGSQRLIKAAIDFAITEGRKSVTLVHKGNIMKFTSGAFRDWGYELARDVYGAEVIDGGPWCRIPEGKPGAGIVIKDVIADAFLRAKS